jgi:hypothetical protein
MIAHPKPAKRKAVAVERFPGGREVCNKLLTDGRNEYRNRTMDMADRQKGLCAICLLPMQEEITFDHQAGRGFGGSNRDDRIDINGKWKNAAVHSRCNAWKASRRYQWIEGMYKPCPSK